VPTGQIAAPQIFATAKNGYEKRATKAVADLEPDGCGLIYIPIGKAPGRNRRFGDASSSLHGDSLAFVGLGHALPDQLAIAPDLTYAMKRNGVNAPIPLSRFENEVLGLLEADVWKRHVHDATSHAIEVPDVEISLAEPGIPLNAMQKVLDRDHRFSTSTRAKSAVAPTSNRTDGNCSVRRFTRVRRGRENHRTPGWSPASPR
jgi:hypothetical protein